VPWQHDTEQMAAPEKMQRYAQISIVNNKENGFWEKNHGLTSRNSMFPQIKNR
jgi:hypothetical protein